MNVYDFDGTIYDGDSSIDFYLFCLKRHPQIMKRIPFFIVDCFRFKMSLIDKTNLKSSYFSFLKYLINPTKDVCEFWDANIHKVKDWYKHCQKEKDVIITASPYFLIDEACRRIGVKYLIASNVDIKTGIFLEPNCHDARKVYEFEKAFPNQKIDCFYSDSFSDSPLARLSERPYLVEGSSIKPWIFK